MTRLWGLSLLFIAWFAGSAGAITSVSPPPATQPSKAVVIVIAGEINEYTRDTLEKRLAQAEQLGAKTVILQLDTYGGMVTAGLEMSAMLKRQTNLHVIAFVPEKAISAGAMVALACDEIVMGPAAKLGDSAPISVTTDGSLQPLPDTERAKFESPILEDFRDSARRHGYDPMLAEAMVSINRPVYWVENDRGERRFQSAAPEQGQTTEHAFNHLVAGVRQPINGPHDLLTVSSDLAVKLGLAKGISADASTLASERGLTIVAQLEPGPGEAVLRVFSSSPARFLLFVVFILSLYVSLHIPGHGAPEAIALISLGLLVGVPWLTGYAQWWEVLFIVGGLALLAFEIFVIPGHGFAALPGILLMLFGFLMTFVPKEPNGLPGFLPSLPSSYKAIENGLVVIVAGLGSSMLLSAWLRKYMPRLPFFNRLILTTTVGGAQIGGLGSPASSIDPAAWPQLGDRGKAATDLRPGGSATFLDPAVGDHRLFSVISDRGYIANGTDVIVQEVGGGRVVVRPV